MDVNRSSQIFAISFFFSLIIILQIFKYFIHVAWHLTEMSKALNNFYAAVIIWWICVRVMRSLTEKTPEVPALLCERML